MTKSAFQLALETSALSSNPISHLGGVAHFVSLQSDPARDKSQRCVLFALVHCGEDGPEAVTTEPLDTRLEGEERTTRVNEIAQTFVDAASAVASTFDRPQRFAVTASPHKATDKPPIAQFPFRVASPAGAAEGGLTETEAPNERGMTAQQMRLFEALSRILCVNIQQSRDRDFSILDKILARQDALEEKLFKMVQQREELLDNSARRQLDAYERRVGIERTERLMQKAETIGEAYLRHKMGLPETETGEDPMVSFAKTLSAEQVIQFVQTLDKSQRAKLFSTPFVAILDEGQKQQMAMLLAGAEQGGDAE